MENYKIKEVRDLMYTNLQVLMDDIKDHIRQNDDEAKNFYNFTTHCHIDKEGWELLFPLPKEKWPKKFQDMEHHYDGGMMWPQYSTYCYIMDVLAPPSIPYICLHFGYAYVDLKLVRSTFFVVQSMVDYQEWPQGMVIDPLALMNNKQPAFYVGCPVPKQDIENWMIHRKNPLEMYIARKSKEAHEERIRDVYMESYRLQMMHEPGWFPNELIEFAKKENLHVPEQARGSYSKSDDDDFFYERMRDSMNDDF